MITLLMHSKKLAPLILLVMMLIIFSCKKENETYYQYIKDGAKVYPTKIKEVETWPGMNRLSLRWPKITDPNIIMAKIFWNNNADSLLMDIDKDNHSDTVEVILNNLREGVYTFDIFTYDDDGNSSIKVDVQGRVYGEKYITSLLNRAVETVRYDDGNVIINWSEASEHMKLTQVEYSDLNDTERIILVLPDESETILPAYQKNSSFSYRSQYIPDSNAIDIFYSHQESVEMKMVYNEDVDLDKKLFAPLTLPGDALPFNQAGNVLSNLWSGVLSGTPANKAWYRTNNGSGMPHHFQLDIGIINQLTSFKFWQRGTITVTDKHLLFSNGNLKRWEIWGSKQPASNGSYDGWVKLLDCESIKPSGNPVGQNTPEDIDHAGAGEEFVFPKGSPEVRYIRIKVLETWGKTDYMFASEFSFKGNYWVADITN